MKRLVGSAVFVLVSLFGTAQAALVSLTIPYTVDFADGSIIPEVGLPNGSVFQATLNFDDSAIDTSDPGFDAVVIPGGGPGTFDLDFGAFSFGAGDDLLGGPLVQFVKGTTAVDALFFEALFIIASGPATGEYLLSFSGQGFQVTPSGNTVDFKMTGMMVPEPSSYLLVIAGVAALATVARRRNPLA